MAEIKSTLDLVMERTKHMQLSDEERQAQRSKEADAKIRGLLQKMVDQAVRLEHFAKDYQRVKSDYALDSDAKLIAACAGQLRIAAENRVILDVLESVAGVERGGVETILDRFQNRYHELCAHVSQRQSEILADQYLISGTAVVANPHRDDRWPRDLEALESEFRRELDQIH